MSCASCQFGSSFAAVNSASPTMQRSARRGSATCLAKRVSSLNSATRSAPPTVTISVPNTFLTAIGPRSRSSRNADWMGVPVAFFRVLLL